MSDQEATPEEGGEPVAPGEEETRDRVRQFYQGQTVINHFYQRVRAGTVGVSGEGADWSRRRSGPLTEAEITGSRDRYVPPPCYVEAAELLTEGRVRVLALVEPGRSQRRSGKRSGAINLLLTVAGTLVDLSPGYTLEELAARDYRKGYGYLLCGWAADGQDPEVTDFHVRALEKRLQEAEAHLVITGAAHTMPPVRQVTWGQPPPDRILRAYGLTGAPLEAAAQAITAEHIVADVVALARALARGERLDTALDGLEAVARRRVGDWFEQGPNQKQIFEMTAAVFTANLPERTFERLHGRLAAITDSQPHPPEGDAEAAPMPETRRRRVSGDSLLVVERGTDATGIPERRLTFRTYGYRGHVVSELWDRHGARVWEPVAEWLDDIVVEPDVGLRVEIAQGLALLAAEDFPYVHDTFLRPWAGASRGWTGQVVAANTLSWMCLNEGLPAHALRTAIRWSRSKNENVRTTSALAFSGEIAVRFPAEAVRRLWYLVQADDRTSGSARQALVLLFETLTTATGNALAVLDWLDRRVRTESRVGEAARPLLRTVLMVLSARDSDLGTPVAALQLRRRPDSADVLGRLWAALLVNRPYRRTSISTLHETLSCFDERDAGETEVVKALMAALARALPVRECPLLARDFRTYVMTRDLPRHRLEVFLSLLHLFFGSETDPPSHPPRGEL
ncbi:hypothetical protein [Microbispora amethystogenes]|uniref:Uncharacterized protein n=1 Tax=Microbispora amethystogenes TaxID=1427754 RepID=A0ABQ4F9V8_9ACTN|nr:hypothetical protein [Microbispora amethystogenes]GIH31554.1 hypothetical protein Mam01_17180 [Microbispora amethystogenes]